jgi:hypothetical protein
MGKIKNSVAVTECAKSASLIAAKWAHVEAAARRTLDESEATATVRLVAAQGRVSGVIQASGLSVVFQDGQLSIEASALAGESE